MTTEKIYQISNAGCDIYPHQTLFRKSENDEKFISGDKRIGGIPLSWATIIEVDPSKTTIKDGNGYEHADESTIFCRTTIPGGCNLNYARRLGWYTDDSKTGKFIEAEYSEVEAYMLKNGLKIKQGQLILADEYVTFTKHVAKIQE